MRDLIPNVICLREVWVFDGKFRSVLTKIWSLAFGFYLPRETVLTFPTISEDLIYISWFHGLAQYQLISIMSDDFLFQYVCYPQEQWPSFYCPEHLSRCPSLHVWANFILLPECSTMPTIHFWQNMVIVWAKLINSSCVMLVDITVRDSDGARKNCWEGLELSK